MGEDEPGEEEAEEPTLSRLLYFFAAPGLSVLAAVCCGPFACVGERTGDGGFLALALAGGGGATRLGFLPLRGVVTTGEPGSLLLSLLSLAAASLLLLLLLLPLLLLLLLPLLLLLLLLLIISSSNAALPKMSLGSGSPPASPPADSAAVATESVDTRVFTEDLRRGGAGGTFRALATLGDEGEVTPCGCDAALWTPGLGRTGGGKGDICAVFFWGSGKGSKFTW